MIDHDQAQHAAQGQPALTRVALRGLCPACGEASLFRHAIAFNPKCHRCDLDFEAHNVGDGPAPFIILIVGAIVLAGAAILEVSQRPPIWLHALIWLPLTACMSLALLRVAKAALLASEYRNRAGEGRAI